ncbi:MAG: HlyD family efflux transporter periplasmic adaptor subunit [Chloroflexi bacterium]|nr:HlyD family efflux transporter periplasmic adaptor subunit [Chloroflexota bacterium]
MNKTRNLIIGFIILAAVVAGGFWLWQSQTATAASDQALEATGVIEARTVNLAPEVGGRVLEVLVEEGEGVSAGQPLLRLDDAVMLSQRHQASAALQAAQANLDLLKAGARSEQIAAARAQLAQAQANVRMVQANLNALTAGTQPEVVTATQTSLAQAWEHYNNLHVTFTTDQLETVRAALTTAEDNLAAARAHRDDHVAADTRNPDYVLAAFGAAVADAEAAVSLAQQTYDAARDDSVPYVSQIELARQSRETAQSNLTLAQARYDGLAADERTTADALEAAQDILDKAQTLITATQSAYEALTSGSAALQLHAAWNEVQRLQAQLNAYAQAAAGPSAIPVEALIAQLDAAKAQERAAAASLAALQSGARPQEIAAAQAQVEAAQAQLNTLDVQLAKYTLTAPWDGIVLTRSAEPGATVLPGGMVLEIGRLDRLKLTVYLAEDQFGLVTPGQSASVRVDSYPDRVFAGTVLRLADEAEFTPTNIQTKEDRVRLVYAVTISLDNADLALKPGMIADATFGE